MPVDSFLGTFMCGDPLKSCPGDASPPAPANSSNLSGGAIAGIAVGAIALLLILVVLFLIFRCRTKQGESRSSGIHPLQQEPAVERSKNQLVFLDGSPRVFNLEDLLRASAEVLGEGKSGIAYKAEMETDLVVVVKRFKDLKAAENDFVKKIESIGAVKHPNLVPLLAYYYSGKEKLLVYDYIPKGNLSSLLHGADQSPLNWETRVNIALDAARGIEHIHSISPSSSHGNIKSSNILITSSFEARVSDHGIAHFAGGYLAQKADVFRFGVVLLELVTGKDPDLGMIAGGGVGLPRWVESVGRGEWTGELFDPELVRSRSPEEEMIVLLQVGVDCSSELPENRPEMAAVVARIEGIRRSAARSFRDAS